MPQILYLMIFPMSFTGIGQTFDLSVGGANTTGIQTGSSILTYWTVYSKLQQHLIILAIIMNFLENGGVSQVSFTGITSSNGSLIISDNDVNQNQLTKRWGYCFSRFNRWT